MTNRSMTATLKYALSSERKLSVVARLIRGKQVGEVLTLLQYLPKKAAKILWKVVKSASSNAQNNMNIAPSSLYVKEVLVSRGPKIKRVRSVGRSRMHGYLKHRSFVKVVLDVQGAQTAPAPVATSVATQEVANVTAPAKKPATKKPATAKTTKPVAEKKPAVKKPAVKKPATKKPTKKDA